MSGGLATGQEQHVQLSLLSEIDRLSAALPARIWLRGGWAVDFLLGDVTRVHADLDLVTWQRHRRRLQLALTDAGFSLERELAVQTDFIKDGQDITFVFLEREPDGTIVAHGIPEWTWPENALPLRRHCLHGVCVRVVAPEQMLRDFEGYETATGRTLRPKDYETMKALCAIVETPQ